MTNIEIPEEIQATVQRILGGREFQMATTVELAEFIRDLNKPEIEVEPFVIYKVKVQGDNEHRMGFRVSKDVMYPWVVLSSHSSNKEDAYSLSQCNTIHQDEDITVIERWTPEPVFGIGDPEDEVILGREVLIKGTVDSSFVDDDGDVRVEMVYSDGLTDSHYVRAADVAYVKEAN